MEIPLNLSSDRLSRYLNREIQNVIVEYFIIFHVNNVFNLFKLDTYHEELVYGYLG